MDNKKIDMYYNLIDKACMIYYNDIRIDYLEAFIKVSADITNEFDESKLSSSAINKLIKIYEEIEKVDFLNEEVRLASELLLIKGFKHRNLLLDFVTPDVINYLFSYIINSICDNNKKYASMEKLRMMDTVLGTGNLIQTIINNSVTEISAVGIEKDELLVHLAKALSDLLDNELVINYQDAKDASNSLVDIVVGDFGESNDVYKIILQRLNNLDDLGYFVYLINNDFFSKADKEFREELTKLATLIGLVVLPQSFVSSNHVGKSILIGRKQVLNDYQMGIVQLDEDLNQSNVQNVFNKINKMIKKLDK